MLPTSDPDRIDIAFDDDRLVDHAGLLLPATLAGRLGLRELVDAYLDLGDAPGRANAGDKLLTLVASALAGGECIDDAAAVLVSHTGFDRAALDGAMRNYGFKPIEPRQQCPRSRSGRGRTPRCLRR